jgi:hypothetical protein
VLQEILRPDAPLHEFVPVLAEVLQRCRDALNVSIRHASVDRGTACLGARGASRSCCTTSGARRGRSARRWHLTRELIDARARRQAYYLPYELAARDDQLRRVTRARCSR